MQKYGSTPFRRFNKGKYKVHFTSKPSSVFCLQYNWQKKYVLCVQVLILSQNTCILWGSKPIVYVPFWYPCAPKKCA